MTSPLIRGLLVAVIAAVVAGCDNDGVPGEGPRIDYSRGTHLVMLGTGTPNAEPDRSGSALAVLVDGTPYLVDAGAGIVRRATAAVANGVEPLRPANLHHLFVTHLHSDHTVGLPDVIFTPWVLERDVPLKLFGPPGIASMVDHLHAAYESDIRVRLDGLEPANPHGYRVEVQEIDADGVVYEDSRVRVTAFAVQHGAWPRSYGYRFESADRVIVVSGDAAPSEAVVEYCDGCDILVHEVYSQAGFERRDPVWQRYHSASHTSSVELAELATRARPGLLVLYHQLYWQTSDEDLLEEIAAGYDGPVLSGRDLEVY